MIAVLPQGLIVLVWVFLGILLTWLILEVAMRAYLELPLKTGFYGSIFRQDVPARQKQVGLRYSSGRGWIQLAWIADIDRETYRIEKERDGEWHQVGKARFGSFLVDRDAPGHYRVWAVPKNGSPARNLGDVFAACSTEPTQVFVPRIAGEWKSLFKPQKFGSYINDHTIYQDGAGHWRLVGITSLTDGEYAAEKNLAVGESDEFPPRSMMREMQFIADCGDLAWAPHVIRSGDEFHLFWSPHRLHHMVSQDGVNWHAHRIIMQTPYNRFFRDASILQIGENHWLMYATGRGKYFSRIDLYQSFDLLGWQYIGPALSSSWGSERNAIFASMESPLVTPYRGGYYLSTTFNNDSFFWTGILLMFKKIIDRDSYNETLIFYSSNPFEFGVYKGKRRSSSFIMQLTCHAPRLVLHPQTDAWYITTAGWPWAATLTTGEAAFAPLEWNEKKCETCQVFEHLSGLEKT